MRSGCCYKSAAEFALQLCCEHSLVDGVYHKKTSSVIDCHTAGRVTCHSGTDMLVRRLASVSDVQGHSISCAKQRLHAHLMHTAGKQSVTRFDSWTVAHVSALTTKLLLSNMSSRRNLARTHSQIDSCTQDSLTHGLRTRQLIMQDLPGLSTSSKRYRQPIWP